MGGGGLILMYDFGKFSDVGDCPVLPEQRESCCIYICVCVCVYVSVCVYILCIYIYMMNLCVNVRLVYQMRVGGGLSA